MGVFIGIAYASVVDAGGATSFSLSGGRSERKQGDAPCKRHEMATIHVWRLGRFRVEPRLANRMGEELCRG
jgi:hypothetical protein